MTTDRLLQVGDIVTSRPMRILGIDRHGNATLERDGWPKALGVEVRHLAELMLAPEGSICESLSIEEATARVERKLFGVPEDKQDDN